MEGCYIAGAPAQDWLHLDINAGVGIWLGATEDPAMYVSTAVMALVLGTWRATQSWSRARAQVGDQYLVRAGLAVVYADLLTVNFTDHYTRDRAVRLRYAQLQDMSPVVQVASSLAAPAPSPARH